MRGCKLVNNYGIPTIKPFKFYTQHVIPLTYDSLSYYEVLEKVKIKLNEVINNINSWSDAITDYTDSQIAQLKSYVDSQDASIRQDLNQAQTLLQQQMNTLQIILTNQQNELDRELRNFVNQQVQNLNNSFNSFVEGVNNMLTQIRALIYQQDDLIYLKLNEEVQRLENLINEIQLNPVQKVINPVTGEVSDIQTALNDIFYNLKVWALTAEEYDNLYLTATQYDGYNITAWEYDYLGRWYLKEKNYIENKIFPLLDKRTLMHSPFTGTIDSIKNVLLGILNIIRYDGITAEQYDNLELTASEYDDLKLSAYYYDWYGIILIPPSERGLTATEYDTLQILSHRVVSYPDIRTIIQ